MAQKNLSRSEHLTFMSDPATDATLRVIALMEDNDNSAIIRRLIAQGLKDHPVFIVLQPFIKELNPEQYAHLKRQMQNDQLSPLDRIPTEIHQLIKDLI